MSIQNKTTSDDQLIIKGHNPVYFKLANLIRDALIHKYHDQFNQVQHEQSEQSIEDEVLFEVYHMLSEAPQIEMGHIAFACFSWAKKLRTAPPKIANDILHYLEEHGQIQNHPLIEKASPQGPYLNFIIRPHALGSEVVEKIIREDYFKTHLLDNVQKTMVEYSQPNTHKTLHVGHMRNLCLGNALVNIMRYTGIPVISTTYPGDVGTHVAKTLWFLKKNKLEGPKDKSQRGAWLGEIYSQANEELESQRGTDKEEQNRQELTKILKELKTEKGEYYELWKETREWSIELMKEAYAWADVSFDRWFFESEVDSPSIEFAKKLYAEGKLVKDQGAIGMDLNDDKLGFCLLIKSDGTGLYATKDVELARVKFDEFGVKKNIYIVDTRQSHHFKQVFKVLEKIGFEQAKDCYHLPYDVVELPDGAMSSRKGNIVPLMELIGRMEDTIISKYLEKYRGEWTDDEIEQTAKKLANGAIKYGMVRVDNNRKIVFDFEEWLRLDGETGPYLQYVYARIMSLCNKLDYDRLKKLQDDFIWKKLHHPSEIELMVKLMSFNQIAIQSATSLKTLPLTSYLYDLGKLYNQFYLQCPIGKIEDQELKLERLHLSWAVSKVIQKGLNLLGIETVDRM